MSEFEITPRGGVEEVGRSCSHVQAGDRDYLVDCGLKQSYTTEFPTFRGIEPGQIDAVFITHAHIDHIGGLPVAEQRGLIADEASIIMTRPTNALASILSSLRNLQCFLRIRHGSLIRDSPPPVTAGAMTDLRRRTPHITCGRGQ